MKPLGIFLAITSTGGEPAGVDDDYDWYVQQNASSLAAAASTRRSRFASIPERLGKLDRFLTRPKESAARRA
jgi:hypothetical protein